MEKEVKEFGNGAHIIVPKAKIGMKAEVNFTKIENAYKRMQSELEDDMTKAMKNGGTGLHDDWEPFIPTRQVRADKKSNTPEDQLITAVETFLDENLKEVITIINELPRDQLSKIGTKSLLNEVIVKIMKLFNPVAITINLNKIIKTQYDKGLQEAEKQFSQNFLPDNQTVMALEKMTLDNIKAATEEFKEKARGIISRGVLNSRGSKEIATELRDALDITKNRAETIARTEMNGVFNEAHLQGAKDSGIDLIKIWDAHLDNRTSDVCKSLNGKKAGLNGSFKYKGETFMRPPALPNCRSRLIFEEKEETKP